ncbi:TPA: PASTA domain-containing protein [Streptococcus suis]|nr:PASTA domain-containing protein [Streptococcus suis]
MSKKGLGKVAKGVAVAVAAEVGADLVKGVAPAVEKAIAAKINHNKTLIQLPNVRRLNVYEAKEVLEAKGFVVLTMLVKADKKYLDYSDDSVVAMNPKPGKYELGTLVKLSYVDHDVLEKAQEIKVREKQKQEEFQKEVGRRIDNFGKEVGKHANNLNKGIGKNLDNLAKLVAKPFGKNK